VLIKYLISFILIATGKIVDATQEMIALGMCNVLGSFFKSIPTCGAFTRSAVSNASGVQTPFAGIYSAIMALLALTLLTPYFHFIPKATLAAILICAVISLVKFILRDAIVKLPLKFLTF
jgi:sodium-independent sulfate anion transporter 11